MHDLRRLPSVDQLLQTPTVIQMVSTYGRPLTLQAIRSVLETVRAEHTGLVSIPDQSSLLDQVEGKLRSWTTPTLQPVVNATGVILHTNLGRAPLSQAAMKAVQEVSLSYNTLEYDLASGKRGSRAGHAEDLLVRITGAEAAMVVNNNAAAVLMILTTLARRRKVVIARSQLVEIGGGFRIPEVMAQSGAHLAEIGTTNRVHLADYEQAIQEQGATLLMRAHRSNFQIIGFTSEPSLEELVVLSHRFGVPVVDDLGSGSLLDTSRFGLGHEPMIQESLAAGVDLVCFSGDKLLGGPQAGIILGKSELVGKLKKHPLARAIRADKLCLAALSATLLHYLRDEALEAIPVWRMIACTADAIRSRADGWATTLQMGEVIPGQSTIGGGSLPGETLPTWLLALRIHKPDRFLARLRQTYPPIIARLEADQIVFDPRTILPEQEFKFIDNVRAALAIQ